jgi:hypothetical protein
VVAALIAAAITVIVVHAAGRPAGAACGGEILRPVARAVH